MYRNMNIINVDALLNAFDAINCGKIHVAQINSKDFEIKQEVTGPLEGYEAPVGFPNCCEGHKQIFKIGVDRFAAFPNCCEGHKQLNTAKWFKKDYYSYLPVKLVTTIAYTWHCISKCIENPYWFKEIVDYIEYTKRSYGQFPDGYGSPFGLELYLYNLEKNIEGEKEIPLEKKEKLLASSKATKRLVSLARRASSLSILPSATVRAGSSRNDRSRTHRAWAPDPERDRGSSRPRPGSGPGCSRSEAGPSIVSSGMRDRAARH